MADETWTVQEEYEPDENHVGVFRIEHEGPGQPTLAGMAAAVNAKLAALGVPPTGFRSANAILSLKTREIWYYKGTGGEG